MAGSDPVRKIADFDRHYMPDGQLAAEASSRGTSDAHHAELKTNATGFRRSLSEVSACLTHGTASLEEARKLIGVTNVFLRWYKLFRQTTPEKRQLASPFCELFLLGTFLLRALHTMHYYTL